MTRKAAAAARSKAWALSGGGGLGGEGEIGFEDHMLPRCVDEARALTTTQWSQILVRHAQYEKEVVDTAEKMNI